LKLALEFEHFDLNHGDYVDILNQGNYLRFDARNRPAGIFRSDSTIIQFQSDDNDEATGFRINLSLTT
jgi:hypothetical protein